MADLKLDTIEGRTSGTITEVGDLKYQIATAWANFNGTGTVAIRDAYNVSSITDNGTGNYTVNFSQAMDNVDYATAAQVANNDSNTSGSNISDGSLTLSSFVLRTISHGAGAFVDPTIVCVSVLGGKN